jgi:hypothetical protein
LLAERETRRARWKGLAGNAADGVVHRGDGIERAAAGVAERWPAGATGYVFTNLRGAPMAPDRITRIFRALSKEVGLPPRHRETQSPREHTAAARPPLACSPGPPDRPPLPSRPNPPPVVPDGHRALNAPAAP